MEESKKEILAKLYCIKAGLSAISLEKDKLKKEEDQCIQIHKEIDENQNKKNQTIQQLKMVYQDIKSNERNIADLNFQKNKSAKVNIGLVIGVGFCSGIFFGPIIWIVIVFIHDLLQSMKNGNNQFSSNLMGKIWIPMIIVAILTSIIYYLVDKHKKNTDKNKQIQNYQSRITPLKKSQTKMQNDLSNFDETNNRLNQSHTLALKKYDQVKNTTIDASKNLYEALMFEFSSVLDSRDWENIDLIIFYYETGRADTLKEALQQVDKQRRHEELIDAIEEASNKISNTIQMSMKELQSTMITCYQGLSLQLQKQHNQLVQQISQVQTNLNSIGENIGKVNESIQQLNQKTTEYITSIASKDYLQQALLEKISVNSLSLVEDVNYLLFYKKPAVL